MKNYLKIRYQPILPHKTNEESINSPHQVVFVLIESSLAYEKFLARSGLSRKIYKYLSNPQDLVGFGWHNAYLLRAKRWYLSPALIKLDGRQLVEARFPGWNPIPEKI